MAVRDATSLLLGLVVLLHTWRAWAAVEVNMTDKVEAYVRGEAQINCTYTSDDGSGGVTVEWFYETGSGTKVRERLFYHDSIMTTVDKGTPFTDRISVNHTRDMVTLTIRDVHLDDESDFICAIKSLTDGSAEGRTKLSVFVKPKLPTIEAVQSGISVNEEEPSKIGSCEVKNGYPKPNITWYKDTTPLRSIKNEVLVTSSVTTESTGLFSVKTELKKKIVKEDKDAFFYCEVTYFVPGGSRMTETSRINVTVYYPSTAVKIWVESPKGKIKEGDSVELHCSGNGNNPSSYFSIKHLEEETSWDAKITLIENITRLNNGIYECMSTDTETFEELSNTTEVFVNFLDPAVVMPEETIVVDKGNELKATCNALSSLPTETTWFKNGQKVSKGHTLILGNATFDTAGVYDCVVTVPEMEGMTTSNSLLVQVQGPPEMKTSLSEMKVQDKTVELVCDVRGYPIPTINWVIPDGKVLHSPIEKYTDYYLESRVKVDATSDFTAFCNASNEYGTDSKLFKITAVTNSKGVIIAVIIICILLLAILGSVLYFLYKKGKICGRSGKQDLTKEKSSKDKIVVEMKSDTTEEAILLGVNGEKQPPIEQ